MSAISAAAALAAAPHMCAGQPTQAVSPVAATAALWHSSRSATAASSGQQRRRRRRRQSESRDDFVSAAAAAVAGPDADLSADSHLQDANSHSSRHQGRDDLHSGSSDDKVGGGSHVAAETAAAMLASIGTAFFEGPIEIFQHRAQVRIGH